MFDQPSRSRANSSRKPARTTIRARATRSGVIRARTHSGENDAAARRSSAGEELMPASIPDRPERALTRNRNTPAVVADDRGAAVVFGSSRDAAPGWLAAEQDDDLVGVLSGVDQQGSRRVEGLPSRLEDRLGGPTVPVGRAERHQRPDDRGDQAVGLADLGLQVIELGLGGGDILAIVLGLVDKDLELTGQRHEAGG